MDEDQIRMEIFKLAVQIADPTEGNSSENRQTILAAYRELRDIYTEILSGEKSMSGTEYSESETDRFF